MELQLIKPQELLALVQTTAEKSLDSIVMTDLDNLTNDDLRNLALILKELEKALAWAISQQATKVAICLDYAYI